MFPIPMILPKYFIVPQHHDHTVITIPALVVWSIAVPNLITKIWATVDPGPITFLSWYKRLFALNEKNYFLTKICEANVPITNSSKTSF